MPFTNDGAQFLAFRMGSGVPNFISNVEFGTGSGTASITNKTLVTGSVRNNLTGSPDFTTSRKVGFQADFNSITMSGVKLTEFGLFISGIFGTSTDGAGSVWAREAFPAITFDGTNELQVLWEGEVLPG